jgi:sugar phosphate isomerase/epimerase
LKDGEWSGIPLRKRSSDFLIACSLIQGGKDMRKKVYMIFGFLFLSSIVFAAVNTPKFSKIDLIKREKGLRAESSEYKDIRIRKYPIAIQCWTFREYTFQEALERTKALGIDFVQAYPGQALGLDKSAVEFDHNLSEKNVQWVQRKLEENGQHLIAYGVVDFDNTEKDIRKVFDFAKKLGIRTIVAEPRFDDFSLLERMVKEYNINLAIHNHPAPSKYARPEVVLSQIKGLDRRIGACVDTGHWMRSGVKPLEGLKMLEGRIMDVHLKDLDAFGELEAEDVPFGKGLANVHDILAELTKQNFRGYLAVEYEKEAHALNPAPPILEGLAHIKDITYYEDFEEILSWWDGKFSKSGWNHYGPGYFVLDEKTGILKSQGGMGLLWYSRKKYGDFVLELEFKCSQTDTNSGIFLRVPEVPSSDDYIYHSFEIQVYDCGTGVHKTGAIYDAEAPRSDAFKPTGEWNFYEITFREDRIRVKLNGTEVVDWKAESRGKIKDFAREGYIGFQNHDSISPVYFRNIYVKEF